LPSLIRFLILLGGVVGLIYGGLFLLATSVTVKPREITEIVELPKTPK
jgi:hypothetical protein